MRRIHFDDADHLGEVVRQASVEMAVARGGAYRGGIVTMEAGGLTILWGSHGVPMIVRGQAVEAVTLTAWRSSTPARCEGQPAGEGAIFYPSGSELQGTTDGPCSWVAVSVANLEKHAASLAPHAELGAGSGRRFSDGTNPPVPALRALLREARRAVDSGLAASLGAPATHALAEQLGAAIVRAVVADEPRRSRERSAACSALVRRADDYLRARGHQPVPLPELCAVLQASEARLREAFQRIYGTSPSRYLRLRRLHLVRRKLRSTRREECTVTAAAASLGFFEFGRFAAEYRAAFGELPSATLRAR